MHEKLIQRLRDTSKICEAMTIFFPQADGNAMSDMLKEAADVIEMYDINLREYGAVPEAMEMFWDKLGDIPVNDDGIIQESFLWWPEGTNREDIWHWFDEKYPGGVKKLMKLED